MSDDTLIWGVSGGHHDGAVAVFTRLNGRLNLVFAIQEERISGVKNDSGFCNALQAAGKWCEENYQRNYPDAIVWFEKPYLKWLRYALSLRKRDYLGFDALRAFCAELFPEREIDFYTESHHDSHAAFGVMSDPRVSTNDSLVLVLDGVGELATVSVYDWEPEEKALEKLATEYYPFSPGLFYANRAAECGFKTNEEEFSYLAIGGVNRRKTKVHEPFFRNALKSRLVNWRMPADAWMKPTQKHTNEYEVAAHAQITVDHLWRYVERLLTKYHRSGQSIVLAGGVALNCVISYRVSRWAENHGQSFVWVSPNPGDSGSAVGCVISKFVREESVEVTFQGHKEYTPFLGLYEPFPDPDDVVSALLTGPVGLVSGRNEFGPRALGARSILSLPTLNGKRVLNQIKGRQWYRPVSPVMRYSQLVDMRSQRLHAEPNFDMQLMQFAVKYSDWEHSFNHVLEPTSPCLHLDRSVRVQAIKAHTGASYHPLAFILKRVEERTGHRYLMNTSLNIKGRPMMGAKDKQYAPEGLTLL